MEELSKILFGAVGGGLAATIFKFVDARLASGQTERESTRAALKKYARPLWLAVRDLEFRLKYIKSPDSDPNPLRLSPQPDRLDWFVKDGYFATSTAYVISAVASWLTLFRRDIVFLDFGKAPDTAAFFQLVQDLQSTISTAPSILWYQYFDAIGSELIEDGRERPMSFAVFCRRLSGDDSYRLLYDQLFQFVKRLPGTDYDTLIADTLTKLRSIRQSLADAKIVPGMVTRTVSPSTSRSPGNRGSPELRQPGAG